MMDVYAPERWSWEIATPSTDPVVDQSFVELHTELVGVDALTLLDQYIDAATELVSIHTNRVLLASDCVLKLDRFPVFGDEVIELPGGRVGSVSSITYLDSAGVEQTWAAENYELDLSDRHGNGRVGLAADKEWPTTRGRGLCVTINYSAGWATAADVPVSLRQCIAMVARTLYDHRDASVGSVEQSPWFRAMLMNWRVWRAH